MLDFEQKIISASQINSAISKLKQPLVFTNGCFDILHRGHITYLQQARNLGNSLVVAVNTDNSVKRQNKGEDRPINCLEDRMSLLASLESVDAVIAFDEDTPLKLIEQITPQILVKGGDWDINHIVGADHVRQHGGEIHSIPFKHQRSTTNLLEKIRSSN